MSPIRLAHTKSVLPKSGASRREAAISIASEVAPATKTSSSSSQSCKARPVRAASLPTLARVLFGPDVAVDIMGKPSFVTVFSRDGACLHPCPYTWPPSRMEASPSLLSGVSGQKPVFLLLSHIQRHKASQYPRLHLQGSLAQIGIAVWSHLLLHGAQERLQHDNRWIVQILALLLGQQQEAHAFALHPLLIEQHAQVRYYHTLVMLIFQTIGHVQRLKIVFERLLIIFFALMKQAQIVQQNAVQAKILFLLAQG